MNVNAGSVQTAGRAIIKVACPDCGWTNEGGLVLVDRYETDYPPVPRGDGTSFLELYHTPGGDPDDRIGECGNPDCAADLEPYTVVEAVPHDDLPLLVALTEMASAAHRAHHELRIKLSRLSPEQQADVMSAENWLRMATPMLRGAAADIRKYVEKET